LQQQDAPANQEKWGEPTNRNIKIHNNNNNYYYYYNERLNWLIDNTSMAKEFPIRSVQSRRCWFLTTG